MKLTKRKGFNFFRSYFDVYNELNDKEKVMFIDALLERQFLGIKPRNLTGMAKFAYISQTNSIDSQVKGFEDKTGIILTPTAPPTDGGTIPPTEQVEEKVEVQVKEEVKEKKNPLRAFHLPFTSDAFYNAWIEWEQFRKEIKKKITPSTAKKQLQFLGARGEPEAIAIINQSITNGWTGLFELKKNGSTKDKRTEQIGSLAENLAKRVMLRNQGGQAE